MSQKTVAVIFGSISSEYEVSLRSASSVLRNISAEKYQVIMLGITKDGRWLEYTGPIDLIEKDEWSQSTYTTPALLSPDRSHGGMLRLTGDAFIPVKIDAVFPVLHGEHGEDGTIQGLFEMAGLPYVGCGVLASATCMDKETTHMILEANGIEMTPYVTITAEQFSRFSELEPLFALKIGYPMFVKPANAGSSVGVSKAKNKEQLYAALQEALRYDRKVLIETAVEGDEVECAVLGNYTDAIASVVGELVPEHEFYDYAGKYLDDSTTLHIPARIPGETAQKIRFEAVKAYAAMGCTGLARVDFFVSKDGRLVLNEINTIPGFTSISMYPKLFEAAGIPYSELIDRLLALAVEKRRNP